MNSRIGFIASDVEMVKMLYTLYPEMVESGELLIEVFDNNSIETQGRKMVDAGAGVIIGRSGGYFYNEGKVSVPLLRLKVSIGDLVIALHKASKVSKKIDMFLWDQISFDTNLLDMFDADINIHVFPTGDEIETLYNSVVDASYNGVVVGGGVVCSLSRRHKIPYIFVSPSEDSISDIMDYAKDMLNSLREVKYKNELLTTVVQGGYDAVLTIDENYQIVLFNDRASDILKVKPKNVIGKKLLEIFPEFMFLILNLDQKREQYGELLTYNNMTLTYNASLIRFDEKVNGVLLSFQDITKLQRLEQKIRYEMSDKGLVGKFTFKDIIYKGELMADVVKRAQIIAKSDSTAIIYGDSGTGKEIIASSMHNLSERKSGPFVAVNCAALSESLLESELFGYEEGAFTGARKGGKPGLFELAHGGTIFLDEINSMSLGIQAKLLRVVEQKDVMRIGSDRVIPLDVRILCAANEDLNRLVQENQFRKDLFYRLNSLEVHLPPLRERKEDIPALVEFFLKEEVFAKSEQFPNEQEMHKMMAYDWPGNVRELKSVCERFKLFGEVVLYDGNAADDMADEKLVAQMGDAKIDLKEVHKLVEKQIINQLLSGGMNKSQIADMLGISRTVLWRKMNDD